MAEKRRVPSDYFVLISPGKIVFIGIGLFFMLVSWQWPESHLLTQIPSLGPFLSWLGKEHNLLVKLCFVPVMSIHIIEVFVGFYYCYKFGLTPLTTLKWTLQISVVGYLCLCHLVRPLPERLIAEKLKK
ncbi:transmembrane protein 254-like isoform X1 [Palaemon carinicauda]|uniref:transmembrane protein 254-like isoform X1 n=1 Tax=Palaemon carinicauda TaxID=392227 RepID=UPI0035B575AA